MLKPTYEEEIDKWAKECGFIWCRSCNFHTIMRWDIKFPDWVNSSKKYSQLSYLSISMLVEGISLENTMDTMG